MESIVRHSSVKGSLQSQAKFSYSFDEESYHGEFETREAAIEEGRLERPEVSLIFTGENHAPDILFGVDADRFLEDVTMTDDFQIEQAEDWPNATKEQMAQLTELLRAAFQSWITANKLEPRFWNVEDIKEHVINP